VIEAQRKKLGERVSEGWDVDPDTIGSAAGFRI